MKKNTRNLLIMLGVLVVAGGAAAALLLNPAEPEEEVSSSSASSSVSVSLISREAQDVASIQVENEAGGFTLVPGDQPENTVTSGESSSDSTVSSTIFTVSGLEDQDLNATSLSTVSAAALGMNATKTVGDQEDLEAYGLSGEGRAKITVTGKDGTAQELILGNAAAAGSGQYALQGATVYVISTQSELFYNNELSFLNTLLYTVPDLTSTSVDSSTGSSVTTTETDILYSLELSGTHFDMGPIVVSYDTTKSTNYLISSPIKSEVSTDKLMAVVTALKSITAASAVQINANIDDLEGYGLSAPYAQAVFDINGSKHTVTLSQPDSEGSCYITVDESGTVYQIPYSSVEAWAGITPMDIRMSYIWLPNIMDVSKLSVTAGADAYVFDVTRVVNEEKTTESNTVYDLTIANAEGENIAYENYQPFYQSLISLPVLNCDMAAHEEKPAYSVTFDRVDLPSSLVEYYAADGLDRYVAYVDGVFSGQVRKTSVDQVFAQASVLYEGRAIA